MILFHALPSQFDRAKYVEIASQLQIPESIANKQIAKLLSAGLLTKQAHGYYISNPIFCLQYLQHAVIAEE